MNIFGGNTGVTYEDLQRKKAIAERLRQDNTTRSPRNVGEGLHAIARALVARGTDRQVKEEQGKLDAQWKEQLAGMDIDPARKAIWETLPYDQRQAAVLRHMDMMDAERRAQARAGASAARAAAKDAEKAEKERLMREGILSALQPRTTQSVTPNPSIPMSAGMAGEITTQAQAPNQQDILMALLGNQNVPVDMVDDVLELMPGAPGDGTEYGLSPQYGVDDAGNPVLLQLGKDGTATRTAIPDGVTFQKEPIKIDAGTEWILLDPISRQPVGSVPKNIAEAEGEKVRGKAEAEAAVEGQQALPGAVAQANEMVTLIDSVINDPALPGITGMVQGRLPPMSQAGTDLNAKVKQIQGKAFLEAFETLKGGGQITEREGLAAQDAMARLDRAQSTEAYTEALSELRGIVMKGLERAQGRAGVAPLPAQTAAPAPKAATRSFATMGQNDLLQVDIMSLSDEEMDAYEARWNEVMK